VSSVVPKNMDDWYLIGQYKIDKQ